MNNPEDFPKAEQKKPPYYWMQQYPEALNKNELNEAIGSLTEFQKKDYWMNGPFEPKQVNDKIEAMRNQLVKLNLTTEKVEP